MIKRKAIYIILVLSISLCSEKPSFAASNCEQSFTLFALTKIPSPTQDQGIFWITKDVGGECLGSYLIQVSISTEQVVSCSTPLMGYGEWDWLKEGVKHMQRQPLIELKEKEGAWYCSTASFQVMSPSADSLMLASFHKASYEGNEGQWISEHGEEAVSLPNFEGVNAKLIYYNKGGLYIGYKISKALFFPHSGFLLVFTIQPLLASGLDTMHGFLIFSLNKKW
ncbi:MAG: hypothetical protein ABII96_00655 [Candidatus Zixiibacteriota bacterium]